MSNHNQLRKVSDESVILSLLSSAKETALEVFVWRLVGESKHLANVKIESVRKARNDFCIVPVNGHEKMVQDIMSSQNFVDIYVPDSAMLLRCNIRQTEAPTRYYVQIPSFIAQVERRKSLRLNVHETNEVSLKFDKSISVPKELSQHFKKTCFDVSTGGISFLVSRMESKFFKINDPIRNIELDFGNYKTRVSAQIALVKEIEPDEFNGLTYKVWRVCCRFSQIDQITQRHLEKFIFERIKEELHAINA